MFETQNEAKTSLSSQNVRFNLEDGNKIFLIYLVVVMLVDLCIKMQSHGLVHHRPLRHEILTIIFNHTPVSLLDETWHEDEYLFKDPSWRLWALSAQEVYIHSLNHGWICFKWCVAFAKSLFWLESNGSGRNNSTLGVYTWNLAFCCFVIIKENCFDHF